MIKIIREIGLRRAKDYVLSTIILIVFRAMIFSPLRVGFLRLCGAKIGKNCVIHRIGFMNADRFGFKGLTLGDECFIGDDVLFDLASQITLGNQVTIAARAIILTHRNVGLSDHPLRSVVSTVVEPVVIGSGCFVGVNSTILQGVVIGAGSCVGAHCLLSHSIKPGVMVSATPPQEHTVRVKEHSRLEAKKHRSSYENAA